MQLRFPKPQTAYQDRIDQKRIRESLERDFKRAVWERDGGICRHCDRSCLKQWQAHPRRGEVHHRRGRNVAPHDRFNPAAAVLLCMRCHNDPRVIAIFRK